MYQNCGNTCGTCVYSIYDKEIHDFVCDNENSDNYGLPVAYGESCELQEARI